MLNAESVNKLSIIGWFIAFHLFYLQSYQRVDVIINDINDNPPVFTPENINKVVNITEVMHEYICVQGWSDF